MKFLIQGAATIPFQCKYKIFFTFLKIKIAFQEIWLPSSIFTGYFTQPHAVSESFQEWNVW